MVVSAVRYFSMAQYVQNFPRPVLSWQTLCSILTRMLPLIGGRINKSYLLYRERVISIPTTGGKVTLKLPKVVGFLVVYEVVCEP